MTRTDSESTGHAHFIAKSIVESLVIIGFLCAPGSGCSLTYNLHDRYDFDLVDGGGAGGPDATNGRDGDISGSDGSMGDAGAPTEAPRAVFPWNGYMTGSSRVSRGASFVAHPRNPTFLWENVPGAEYYSIQIESDCPTMSFQDCAFPDPEVDAEIPIARFRPSEPLPISEVVPVGRRYFWRVRACNFAGCGRWSTIRYLDVGRLKNDYNGDGYSDLVVGAPFQDNPEPDEGSVYVFYGSATGIQSERLESLDNPIDDAYGRFGDGIAPLGDVNGDGYSDVAIAASNQENSERLEGGVYIFYGSNSGIDAERYDAIDSPFAQISGYFGDVVFGAGDLNSDGYADLVVGSPSMDRPEVNEGAIYLYMGGVSGISTDPTFEIENPENQAAAYFGDSIGGSCDLNRDGYVDFIVGAPRQDRASSDEGVLFAFMGPLSQLSDLNSPLVIENPEGQPGSEFGGSIACIESSVGDGYPLMVVGSAYQDYVVEDEGAVYVFMPNVAMSGFSLISTIGNPTGQGRSLYGFGISSVGDIDGDGSNDLILPLQHFDGTEIEEGIVFGFAGSAGEIASTPSFEIGNPTHQLSGRFGGSLAEQLDLNGDGYRDLAIGAPSQSYPENGEGNVFVYYGSNVGVDSTPSVRLDNPLDQESGRFGFVVE